MNREQELVDIMFQVAMVAAEYMHGKSNEEIAAWVRQQLREFGFSITEPVGAGWGILKNEEE